MTEKTSHRPNGAGKGGALGALPPREPKQPPKRSRNRINIQERKERADFDLDGSSFRLKIHPEVQAEADEKDVVLYWANDDGMRVQELEMRNWTVVDAEGTMGRRYVGSLDRGGQLEAVLMAKPREWDTEDRKKKQILRDKLKAELRRGAAPKGAHPRGTPEDAQTIQETGAAYVPKDGIKIGVGPQD